MGDRMNARRTHEARGGGVKSRTQSYAVCDYETGEALVGDPTAELVTESLAREPTGAVGAYLAGGEWRWLDDSDPAPCGAADCRTVYVVEVERDG